MKIIFHPDYMESSIDFDKLNEEEQSTLEHLFDVMTAVRQQVLLRKAIKNKEK